MKEQTRQWIEFGSNIAYELDGDLFSMPEVFRGYGVRIHELLKNAGMWPVSEGTQVMDQHRRCHHLNDSINLIEQNEFFVLEGGPATAT